MEKTASGAKFDRPVLGSLLEQMHAGDVLVIWKLDRLGRSLRDLVDLVSTLKKADIRILCCGYCWRTPTVFCNRWVRFLSIAGSILVSVKV